MKPVTCHLSQRAKISVLSLTVSRFFFGPLLIGINHWRQKKKTTFQRHFPQWAPTTENCNLWFSAPAAYLQALLEARWACGHRATALQSPTTEFLQAVEVKLPASESCIILVISRKSCQQHTLTCVWTIQSGMAGKSIWHKNQIY